MKEIIQRAKAGDTDAIETLYRLTLPIIIPRSYFNGQFNEDLFQELTLQFLKRIKTFDPDKKQQNI